MPASKCVVCRSKDLFKIGTKKSELQRNIGKNSRKNEPRVTDQKNCQKLIFQTSLTFSKDICQAYPLKSCQSPKNNFCVTDDDIDGSYESSFIYERFYSE